MEIDDFLSQVIKLKDRELEQRIWDMWVCNSPYMSMGQLKSISYDEMLNTAKQKEIKNDTPINGVYIDQCFF